MLIAKRESGRRDRNGGRMLLVITVARHQGIFRENVALEGTLRMTMQTMEVRGKQNNQKSHTELNLMKR